MIFTNKLRPLKDNINVTNKIYNMNREFFHTALITITNIAIRAFMVSLTMLFACGLGLLVFKLVTNPSSFNGVGGVIV